MQTKMGLYKVNGDACIVPICLSHCYIESVSLNKRETATLSDEWQKQDQNTHIICYREADAVCKINSPVQTKKKRHRQADWVGYDGKEYKAGSLIAVHWESALKSEAADMTLLFNPTDTKSLDGFCHTKDF